MFIASWFKWYLNRNAAEQCSILLAAMVSIGVVTLLALRMTLGVQAEKEHNILNLKVEYAILNASARNVCLLQADTKILIKVMDNGADSETVWYLYNRFIRSNQDPGQLQEAYEKRVISYNEASAKIETTDPNRGNMPISAPTYLEMRESLCTEENALEPVPFYKEL